MKKITLLDKKELRIRYKDDIAFGKLTDCHGNEIKLVDVVAKETVFKIQDETYEIIYDGIDIDVNIDMGRIVEGDREFFKMLIQYTEQIKLEDYISYYLYDVEDVEDVEDVVEPKVEDIKINSYVKYGFSFMLGVITTLFIKKRS